MPAFRFKYYPFVIASALFSLWWAGNAFALTLQFNDFFSTSGLSLNGTATQMSTSDGAVLRLTSATNSEQAGTVFTTADTGLRVSDFSSFSTFFSFRITDLGGISDGTEIGGDGLVFVLQSLSSSQVGGAGGGIGYGGTLYSVGVEFDTWQQQSDGSGGWDDPSSNHIGIDINGAMESLSTSNISSQFDDGDIWYTWIDYDGTNLEVKANKTGIHPTDALISYAINIPTWLGSASSDAFVGFTSGTAGAYGNHDLLSWTFVDTYAPVPEPATMLLLGSGLVGLAGLRRRFKKS